MDPLLAMRLAQFNYRESLRRIESSLGTVPLKAYHRKFPGLIARATLVDAAEKRDGQTCRAFAQDPLQRQLEVLLWPGRAVPALE